MIQWARRGNRQKGERWLRAILALLLVVFLAYVIARTVWMLMYVITLVVKVVFMKINCLVQVVNAKLTLLHNFCWITSVYA